MIKNKHLKHSKNSLNFRSLNIINTKLNPKQILPKYKDKIKYKIFFVRVYEYIIQQLLIIKNIIGDCRNKK